MKKFPHQKFMEENNIAPDSLPEMLHKRLLGFDELQEDWMHTVGDDHSAMENKLDDLSHELEEDLEEHFEAHLVNNDEEEDETHSENVQEVVTANEPAPHPESVEEKTTEEKKEGEEEKEMAEPISEQVNAPETQEQVIEEQEPPAPPEMLEETKAAKETTDEEILQNFLNEGRHKVLASELFAKGFSQSLGQRKVMVGNFCLHRGRYDSLYKIILISEKRKI